MQYSVWPLLLAWDPAILESALSLLLSWAAREPCPALELVPSEAITEALTHAACCLSAVWPSCAAAARLGSAGLLGTSRYPNARLVHASRRKPAGKTCNEQHELHDQILRASMSTRQGTTVSSLGLSHLWGCSLALSSVWSPAGRELENSASCI